MAIEKIKILGAVLELPAKQHCQLSWPIWPNFEVNGLDWQCCLAGSSKTASRIFIFSIVLGAEYLFYVKSIATYAPTFFGYHISTKIFRGNYSLFFFESGLMYCDQSAETIQGRKLFEEILYIISVLGQSNLQHSPYTLFLPRPARKESNLPKLKSGLVPTVLIYILCAGWKQVSLFPDLVLGKVV